MLLRSRPDIVSFVDDGFFDETEIYNTAYNDFAFAISAERYQRGLKIDPKYVQFVVTLVVATDDSYTEKHLPMTQCTEKDYQRFYPSDKKSAERIS